MEEYTHQQKFNSIKLQEVLEKLLEGDELKKLTNAHLAQVVEDELLIKTEGGTRECNILCAVIERLQGTKEVE